MSFHLPKSEGLIGGQHEIRNYRFSHIAGQRVYSFGDGELETASKAML
ncbi:hypothetical protein [Brucella pituitosa]|uniref:Uncharacterized protein n=1 Tax=Brucella pituitosa TaxID=571256 RepID=A0ABS3JWN9_9HYPH|nr:hypothetical protein [Brucella pituitosa]MBO1039086.1 hypothetical protein [Brucella pituitosa]